MQSDSQLIQKIMKKQSRTAADELVNRYYKKIYAYTYRQTGDMDLSMDLTQEIFIAILKGLPSFDERKAQFGTWAYHIASNKITDYYRSRAYRQHILSEPLPSEERQGNGTGTWENEQQKKVMFQERAEASMILERIINRETIQQVMEVVAGYDTDWIKIFQKKYFREMTFRQIAGEMGLSENTVKSRFYSMISKIRKVVDNDV